jgi:acetolactate synthase-1/2/3 large subunit
VVASHTGPAGIRSGTVIDFTQAGQRYIRCPGFRVQKPGELRDLLPHAFGMGRPVVIDAVTDVNAFARKPWTP